MINGLQCSYQAPTLRQPWPIVLYFWAYSSQPFLTMQNFWPVIGLAILILILKPWSINHLISDHFCDIHRICCRFDHRYDNEYNFFHSASQHQQWANWQSKASSHRSYLHLLVYNWVSPTFSRYIQWTSLTVPTVCTFQASFGIQYLSLRQNKDSWY